MDHHESGYTPCMQLRIWAEMHNRDYIINEPPPMNVFARAGGGQMTKRRLIVWLQHMWYSTR